MNNQSICPECKGLILMNNTSTTAIAMCLKCGNETNTLMVYDSDLTPKVLSSLPKLIQELSFIDKDNFVWKKTIINKLQEGLGMVFPEGTKDEWNWVFTPSKEVEDIDDEKVKKSKYKPDMANKIKFNKYEFHLALSMLYKNEE